MEIKSLENTGFKDVHVAFSKAFADYGLPPMSEEQLFQMVSRRGFDPSLSMGAFEGGELVSFTLNGIGLWNDKLTAYDTGTGTIPEFRSKGLAKQIFIESVPILKEACVKQYLLEVLQTNKVAVKLYQNQGFAITREFDYYAREKGNIEVTTKQVENLEIREIEIPQQNFIEECCDFEPSWQNSIESIKRRVEDFIILGAYFKNELIGYTISQLNTGDITQLAVKNKYRRKGVGTILFCHILKKIPGEIVKIINTEKGIESIRLFLNSLGWKPSGHQYEMIKTL